jgi:antitoxin ParD1/3/4
LQGSCLPHEVISDLAKNKGFLPNPMYNRCIIEDGGIIHMATMNISLPDNMKTFIEAEITEGGYNTASEYFRALVREAQKRKTEAKLEALLLEGLQSGEATPMTEQDWEEIRQEVRQRATKRAAQQKSAS